MSSETAEPAAMRRLAFLQGLRDRHGDVFSLRLVGGAKLLVVSDPELVKRVLLAPADVLHAGEANRPVLEQVLGANSLILLDGERHMRHRRLLSPPLHGERLARHEQAMRAVADEQLARWPLGEPFQALPRLRPVALEAIVRTIVGATDEQRLVPLRAALRALRLPGNSRDGDTPEFRGAVERAERAVMEEIERRRGDPAQGDDVLSTLLAARYDDGSPMSDVEVRDELLTLLVAGAETTAGSLAWALERLVRAPRALERAAAAARDGGGPYLDATIQEVLRIRPVVPMLARLVKQPFELGEHTVEPGITIAPSVLLIHHRADVYPEPAAFRPERFLERPPGTYTWMPFGGGVRRCIGDRFALLEMRVVLTALLARAMPRAVVQRPEGMRQLANTMTPADGAQIALEGPSARPSARPVSGGERP